MTIDGGHPGVLHHYSQRWVAFEHTHAPGSQPNKLLFLGGLADGLLTTGYVLPLSEALPKTYALVEVLKSSSYDGWGTSSLDRDVLEIAECVEYFRKLNPTGKIVLLGHSTGSQDVLHYLISDGERPKVDGGILQGAVSDREGMVMLMPPKEYDTIVKIAQEYIDNGRGDDCLPIALTGGVYPGACSASRWISIASPGPHHVGMDDYFSSDFSDERLTKTFGRVGLSKTPISILYGGQDQYVPTSIDKEALIQKWIRHVKEGGGVVDEDAGVIEGATHALKEGGKPLEELNRRIICFIERIGGF